MFKEIEEVAIQVREAFNKIDVMEDVSQVIIDFEKMQEDQDTLQIFMFGMFWVKVSNLTSKEAQKGLKVTLNESNSVRLTDKVKAFFNDIII